MDYKVSFEYDNGFFKRTSSFFNFMDKVMLLGLGVMAFFVFKKIYKDMKSSFGSNGQNMFDIDNKKI